jgi:hypothetical protein
VLSPASPTDKEHSNAQYQPTLTLKTILCLRRQKEKSLLFVLHRPCGYSIPGVITRKLFSPTVIRTSQPKRKKFAVRSYLRFRTLFSIRIRAGFSFETYRRVPFWPSPGF